MSAPSAPVLALAPADARRLLVRWHLAPTTPAGVFARHASVQFDPLAPMGCNHDLVLQARAEGYRVGGWQRLAYEERLVMDGWDKQASLVPTAEEPWRRVYRRWHGERWRERVLDAHPDAVEAVLAELRARGPLTSDAFEHQVHVSGWEGSWYGPKLTKHVLRALWHTGRVATHHRENGKHAYAPIEDVVPAALLEAPDPPEEEQLRFLLLARHRAVGLLRPNAPSEVWSLRLPAAERRRILADLAAEGRLTAVDVAGTRFHAPPEALAALERPLPEERTRIRFLAPLDPLVWDRPAVRELFGFDYLWEVYKPERERRWGYYVLPIQRGERLVGRLDGRARDGTFELRRIWFEEGVDPAALAADLEDAFARFLAYLGAERARANPSRHAVPRPARDALKAASRAARASGGDGPRPPGAGSGEGAA